MKATIWTLVGILIGNTALAGYSIEDHEKLYEALGRCDVEVVNDILDDDLPELVEEGGDTLKVPAQHLIFRAVESECPKGLETVLKYSSPSDIIEVSNGRVTKHVRSRGIRTINSTDSLVAVLTPIAPIFKALHEHCSTLPEACTAKAGLDTLSRELEAVLARHEHSKTSEAAVQRYCRAKRKAEEFAGYITAERERGELSGYVDKRKLKRWGDWQYDELQKMKVESKRYQSETGKKLSKASCS